MTATSEWTTLRARVLRVVHEEAEFESFLERWPFFGLHVPDESTVRRLSSLVGEEVDIDIRTERDRGGRIVGGVVRDVHELLVTDDPRAVWEAWCRRNAPHVFEPGFTFRRDEEADE